MDKFEHTIKEVLIIKSHSFWNGMIFGAIICLIFVAIAIIFTPDDIVNLFTK